LEPVENVLRAQLQAAEVAHFDESGVRIEGQRHWLHVACTDRVTLYGRHAKRGCAGLEAIGVLPQFDGIAVHDHWRAYFGYGQAHALCNAHHLRELTFVHEHYQQPWAQEMIAHWVQIKRTVDRAQAAGRIQLARTTFTSLRGAL
jgi:transposase